VQAAAAAEVEAEADTAASREEKEASDDEASGVGGWRTGGGNFPALPGCGDETIAFVWWKYLSISAC
jgi:hypothetical protein